MLRRLGSVSVVALVAALSAWLASAAANERRPAFVLESGVLLQRPAIAEALAQVEATPEAALAWQALGRSLTAAGGFNDAVRALEHATRLAPDEPDLWVDLGAAQLHAGQTGRAMTALRRATRLEPYHAIAHYNLGIAHQARGNYDAALAAFEFALRIDPSLADPAKNPTAVVNRDLPYSQLRAYLSTVGSAPALLTPAPTPQSADPASAAPGK